MPVEARSRRRLDRRPCAGRLGDPRRRLGRERPAKRPAGRVLVFADGRLLGQGTPDAAAPGHRQEVGGRESPSRATSCGVSARVAMDPDDIRVDRLCRRQAPRGCPAYRRRGRSRTILRPGMDERALAERLITYDTSTLDGHAERRRLREGLARGARRGGDGRHAQRAAGAGRHGRPCRGPDDRLHGHLDVVPGPARAVLAARRGRPALRPRRLRHEGRARGDDVRRPRPGRARSACASTSSAWPTRSPRRSSSAAPTTSSSRATSATSRSPASRPTCTSASRPRACWRCASR